MLVDCHVWTAPFTGSLPLTLWERKSSVFVSDCSIGCWTLKPFQWKISSQSRCNAHHFDAAHDDGEHCINTVREKAPLEFLIAPLELLKCCACFPLPTVDHHVRAVNTGSYMGSWIWGRCFTTSSSMIKSQCTGFRFDDVLSQRTSTMSVGSTIGKMGLLQEDGLHPIPLPNYPRSTTCRRDYCWGPHGSMDWTNIFWRDMVAMNLPGSPDYDPSKPYRCARCKSQMVRLPVTSSYMQMMFAWLEGVKKSAGRCLTRLLVHWTGQGFKMLHINERGLSQELGAWAWSVMVSQDWWEKTKGIITWIVEQLANPAGISFKPLEWGWGYLLFLSGIQLPLFDCLNKHVNFLCIVDINTQQSCGPCFLWYW